jgi:hypothetical protein
MAGRMLERPRAKTDRDYPRVFVSYGRYLLSFASEDRAAARALTAVLEDAGWTV